MNKGKLLIITMSLMLLAASIWVYLQQQGQRTKLDPVGVQAKAKLIGYELYRYQHDELKVRVSGKRAVLVDPAELICEDKIFAVRIRNGLREQVETEKARLVFLGDSLFTQKDATLDTVELKGGVEYVRGKSRFLTEWLKYTEKTGEAYSDKPVRIDSEGQFVAAEGGMTYNVRDESVRLRGGVFGSLRADKVKEGLGSEGRK